MQDMFLMLRVVRLHTTVISLSYQLTLTAFLPASYVSQGPSVANKMSGIMHEEIKLTCDDS